MGWIVGEATLERHNPSSVASHVKEKSPGPFCFQLYLLRTFVSTFGALLHFDLFQIEVVLFSIAETQRANQDTNRAKTGIALTSRSKNKSSRSPCFFRHSTIFGVYVYNFAAQVSEAIPNLCIKLFACVILKPENVL